MNPCTGKRLGRRTDSLGYGTSSTHPISGHDCEPSISPNHLLIGASMLFEFPWVFCLASPTAGAVGATTSVDTLLFLKIIYKSALNQVPLKAWQKFNKKEFDLNTTVELYI
jgi:hypothetical protein